MKLQRFYIQDLHNRFGPIALGHELWLNDKEIAHQLIKVFRARPGYELILFNDQEERLYKIIEIGNDLAVKLSLVTDMVRKLPKKEVYLIWSVLKKDKNDWIMQKATELGVHKFVPIIAARSEKTDINIERAQKIIIEAAEQCGRGDIPDIREPLILHEALEEYQDLPLFICEQNAENSQTNPADLDRVGVLIGPEGGWTDTEKQDFANRGFPHIVLSEFTLRAETATIVAISKIMN